MMGNTAKRLGALGNAALFHDVGKIAVPDSILTKPEPLTPSEAALMREHAARDSMPTLPDIDPLSYDVPD